MAVWFRFEFAGAGAAPAPAAAFSTAPAPRRDPELCWRQSVFTLDRAVDAAGASEPARPGLEGSRDLIRDTHEHTHRWDGLN